MVSNIPPLQSFISERKKEKDGTVLIGNIIKCEAKKSRLTREGSKIETRLFFDERGLEQHYGLLELR